MIFYVTIIITYLRCTFVWMKVDLTSPLGIAEAAFCPNTDFILFQSFTWNVAYFSVIIISRLTLLLEHHSLFRRRQRIQSIRTGLLFSKWCQQHLRGAPYKSHVKQIAEEVIHTARCKRFRDWKGPILFKQSRTWNVSQRPNKPNEWVS